MVKGYKTVNIKEELIDRIRNLEESKKEIEEGRFNLAGFITKILLEYMNKEPIKKEGLTTEQIKSALKEVLNVITTDINAGITKEDLKQALLGLENDMDMKIRDMLKDVMERL